MAGVLAIGVAVFPWLAVLAIGGWIADKVLPRVGPIKKFLAECQDE